MDLSDSNSAKHGEPEISFTHLENHNAIGFDVDHCLIRYKLEVFTHLLYESFTKTLISDLNYPPMTFDIGETKEIFNFCMNYLIVDVEKGNVMKLGKDKRIIRAYHGLRELSKKDILSFYGEDPLLGELDHTNGGRLGRVFTCPTYFEHVYPLIFSKIIEFKEKGVDDFLSKKTNAEIAEDINVVFKKNFQHFSQDEVRPVRGASNYFNSLLQEMDRYVYKQEEMLKTLKQLKSSGKTLFILSNSHYPYIKETMDFAYGKDWEDLFELIIVLTKKPGFFKLDSQPLYKMDLKIKNLQGDEVKRPDEADGKHFVCGNYKIVEEILRHKKKGINKIMYVGDNFFCDNYYAQKIENWDSVNILEELQELEKGFVEGGLDYKKYWGSFFRETDDNDLINTFWPNFIKENSYKMWPLVDRIAASYPC